MHLEEAKGLIGQNLVQHIKQITPNHSIREIYEYAVLPPGKLFRPQLVWAIANDFSGKCDLLVNSPHSLLCSAVEMHHAYSLVHDDLPCMDDDDMRRGKPSTHKKYGEWRALLVGDGLLNGSYKLLSKIDSPKLSKLFKLFSWALGPKGLIQGQVLDLAEEMKLNFTDLKKTHECKTARLIQTALVGSYIITETPEISNDQRYRTAIDLLKLGHYTGLVFQFLDDLTELVDEEIPPHEKEISPWFNFHELTYSELIKGFEKITTLTDKYKLESFNLVMSAYYKKIRSILNGKETIVSNHFNTVGVKEDRLSPIMSFLDTLS
jgi:geranylgeranyl pyrophosphate synthase